MLACDSCKYHQAELDPEGCFKHISTTGFIGRLFVNFTGCPHATRGKAWDAYCAGLVLSCFVAPAVIIAATLAVFI